MLIKIQFITINLLSGWGEFAIPICPFVEILNMIDVNRVYASPHHEWVTFPFKITSIALEEET